MRILLYTGKGGVGKTTLAAATALRAAMMGYRTIVVSTDAAHSLADSFDLPLGPDPTPISANLWGQEMDVYHQVESYWGTVQKYLEAILSWRGIDGILAEELAVPPGMSELASLLQLVHLHDSNEYDVIILDCAPTGETLELLTLPEIARWWMDKIFPIHRRLVQVARPVIKPLMGMPLPDDDVYEAIEGLFHELDRMQKLLSDPSLTSVRLVVNAEKMVVKEAMRTHTYLSLYGYPVDLVVCNRVIPESVSDSYFESWKAAQAKYIKMVEEGFAPTPIRYVPLMDQEIVGLELLAELGQKLFGSNDPASVYHVDRTYTFEKQGDGYQLLLPLPFVSKSNVDLKHVGDELIVQVGNQKRNLVLPRALQGLRTRGAKLEDGTLKISFAPSNGREIKR